MSKKYVLNRISNGDKAARSLLNLMDHSYLSIGYSYAQGVYDAAIDAARTGDTQKYYAACDGFYKGQKWWTSKRNRNQVLRFLSLSPGDIVLVPLPYGEFSIFEVTGAPKKIADFDLSELGADRGQLSIKNGLLHESANEIDIGFLVPVKLLKGPLPRKDYADASLTSRMKIRQTNAYIDDIKDSVDAVLAAEGPINFYNNVLTNVSEQLLETIKADLNDTKFEALIKWFMEKQGFITVKPPKNDPEKENYADADIVASHELLKLVIYIQAKFHVDKSSAWAVEQISQYAEQKGINDDETYIQWVVTTADDFTDEAKNKALEEGVRLINGLDFAQMLLDAGVANINDAFK